MTAAADFLPNHVNTKTTKNFKKILFMRRNAFYTDSKEMHLYFSV